MPTCKLPCHHVALLAKRDPVNVGQVNLLRVEGEADHFSDEVVTPRWACGPTCGRITERMKKISYSVYRFPAETIHQAIWLNTFNVQRHLTSSQTHRMLRAAAMDTWRTAVAAA